MLFCFIKYAFLPFFQVWHITPTDTDPFVLSKLTKKNAVLFLSVVSLVLLTMLWLFCPQNMCITQVTVISACASVVVLWHVYCCCIVTMNAAGNKQQFDWLDLMVSNFVTLSSICMIMYWVVKYQLFLGSNTVSAVLLGSMYLCTVDWLIVLPRTVLSLCTANIIHVLSIVCIPTNYISNNDYYRRMMKRLVHTIVSFSLILGLMLGPVGCVCMVLCLVHTVVFAYCYPIVVDIVNIRADSNSALTTSITKSASEDSELISRSSSEKLNRLCTYVVYAAYFPLMGRFLYFVTGHRMDFGTLQV